MPTVSPVARSVVAPVAVLHQNGLARLIHELSKDREILELAAPVQLNAVKTEVDRCLDLAFVVVDTIVLARRDWWPPARHVLVFVAAAVVAILEQEAA